MPNLKKFCLHFAFRELLKLYWYSTYAIFFLFLYSLSENNGILISTEYGIKIQAGQKYHYSDWNLLEREGDFYQLHVANTSRDISTINKVDVENASPDLHYRTKISSSYGKNHCSINTSDRTSPRM